MSKKESRLTLGRAKQILRQIAESDPVESDIDDSWCGHCHGTSYEPHSADCTWRRARWLLGYKDLPEDLRAGERLADLDRNRELRMHRAQVKPSPLGDLYRDEIAATLSRASVLAQLLPGKKES